MTNSSRTSLVTAGVVAIALMFSTAAPFAQQPSRSASARNPSGWSAFTQLFDTIVDRDRTVGASVLMIDGGRIVARHEHGLADRASKQPVTERTIFHYGSITKTLTAISIMQLRDRNKLSLADRVTKYIPELRRVHNRYGSMDDITIRMLLEHTSGFQGPTWPYSQGKPWQPFEPVEWAQLVAMMPYQEIGFKPGSRLSYSNPAFIYLARIVEILTGDPWEVYVQKNIFAPLNLTRSYFRSTPYHLLADRSHNYSVIRGSDGIDSVQENGAEFDPGITIPNGGWNAPLDDLATYLAFLTNATLGDSATQRRYDAVLKHSTLEEMWQPLHAAPQGTEPTSSDGLRWMGLSFFVIPIEGTTFIGHTGSQAGFDAFFYLNPKNGKAVVAVFNTSTASAPPNATRAKLPEIRDAAMKIIK